MEICQPKIEPRGQSVQKISFLLVDNQASETSGRLGKQDLPSESEKAEQPQSKDSFLDGQGRDSEIQESQQKDSNKEKSFSFMNFEKSENYSQVLKDNNIDNASKKNGEISHCKQNPGSSEMHANRQHSSQLEQINERQEESDIQQQSSQHQNFHSPKKLSNQNSIINYDSKSIGRSNSIGSLKKQIFDSVEFEDKLGQQPITKQQHGAYINTQKEILEQFSTQNSPQKQVTGQAYISSQNKHNMQAQSSISPIKQKSPDRSQRRNMGQNEGLLTYNSLVGQSSKQDINNLEATGAAQQLNQLLSQDQSNMQPRIQPLRIHSHPQPHIQHPNLQQIQHPNQYHQQYPRPHPHVHPSQYYYQYPDSARYSFGNPNFVPQQPIYMSPFYHLEPSSRYDHLQQVTRASSPLLKQYQATSLRTHPSYNEFQYSSLDRSPNREVDLPNNTRAIQNQARLDFDSDKDLSVQRERPMSSMSGRESRGASDRLEILRSARLEAVNSLEQFSNLYRGSNKSRKINYVEEPNYDKMEMNKQNKDINQEEIVGIVDKPSNGVQQSDNLEKLDQYRSNNQTLNNRLGSRPGFKHSRALSSSWATESTNFQPSEKTQSLKRQSSLGSDQTMSTEILGTEKQSVESYQKENVGKRDNNVNNLHKLQLNKNFTQSTSQPPKPQINGRSASIQPWTDKREGTSIYEPSTPSLKLRDSVIQQYSPTASTNRQSFTQNHQPFGPAPFHRELHTTPPQPQPNQNFLSSIESNPSRSDTPIHVRRQRSMMNNMDLQENDDWETNGVLNTYNSGFDLTSYNPRTAHSIYKSRAVSEKERLYKAQIEKHMDQQMQFITKQHERIKGLQTTSMQASKDVNYLVNIIETMAKIMEQRDNQSELIQMEYLDVIKLCSKWEKKGIKRSPFGSGTKKEIVEKLPQLREQVETLRSIRDGELAVQISKQVEDSRNIGQNYTLKTQE